MPGAVVIAGQLAVKEPGIGRRAALVRLQAAPILGEFVHNRRNNVLAG